MDNENESVIRAEFDAPFCPVYLYVTTGLLKICIIESIVTIANCKFSYILNTVWTTLYSNGRYITNITQINDKFLFEIRIFRRP